MKVKVGQWLRTDTNVFYIIKEVLHGGWVILNTGYGIKLDGCEVADTPRELVQVGDLVEWNNQTFRIGDGHLEVSLSRLRVFDNITAIYTPNKDKTQYTQQWRLK